MSYGKRRRYLARVVAWAKGEDGQALGEYALILAFVAMMAVIALTALGVALPGFWDPLLNIL
jgi:Flp pilus assembly pilin Flp